MRGVDAINGGVTVVISAKDEAENLMRCIPLASALGHVVVVDSGSDDATGSVVENHGAELVIFEWDGKFPKKRNWMLRNYAFQTDWVLFLDADEFVTDSFVDEMKLTIPLSEHCGYWLNFTNHFMGRRLLHGDPFRKLALFRVSAGEYEHIEEDSWSHLDMEVHEHPVIDGSVGEIHAPIDHVDYRGVRHWIKKHNEYSDWEARRYMRLLKEGEAEWDKLTSRQRAKYRHLTKWWFPVMYFCGTYFFKKGCLDGAVGLHFALLKAWYFYSIRLKIEEFRRAQ